MTSVDIRSQILVCTGPILRDRYSFSNVLVLGSEANGPEVIHVTWEYFHFSHELIEVLEAFRGNEVRHEESGKVEQGRGEGGSGEVVEGGDGDVGQEGGEKGGCQEAWHGE